MVKQVVFVAATGAIVQWRNLEQFNYPAIADTQSLLSVSEETWSAFYETALPCRVQAGEVVAGAAPPTPAEAAQIAFNSAFARGCPISSVSVPALSGSFSLDPTALLHLVSERTYIATTGTFSNKGTSKAWPDKDGVPHVFSSVAEFVLFAEAIAEYYDALLTALARGRAGEAWSPPATPVVIL